MISFIHRGGPEMASYRYRAAIPAAEIGASMNDLDADVLVFAKPHPDDVEAARAAKARGARVIVDFCDPHFSEAHYVEMALAADAITCPTPTMAREIRAAIDSDWWIPDPVVIDDPFEWREEAPHCNGVKLLWFGHGSNFESLRRVIRTLDDYPLMIVSNLPWAMPWSREEMEVQFCAADIAVIPATAPHKSANRAVEAIRQGLFVVAEPHPSLEGFPGIWIGNMGEGIEWARHNLQQANLRTWESQKYVSKRFSPSIPASAWKTLCETVKSRSTSAAGASAGRAGSTSTSTRETLSATCAS